MPATQAKTTRSRSAVQLHSLKAMPWRVDDETLVFGPSTTQRAGRHGRNDGDGMTVPPNSIPMVGGIGPYDEITMGGMFTILKVRENLPNYDEDLGWYQTPPGTLASLAPASVLRQNGIAIDASTAPSVPTSAMKSWQQAPPTHREEAAPANHSEHGSLGDTQ